MTTHHGPGCEPVLLIEISDRVATLSLNRPRSRNALSAELRAALIDTVHDLDRDPDVDALIITGTDPAFCAGLDLAELASGQQSITDLVGNEAIRQNPLPAIGKPVIGAINGAAITGGLEVVLACDFLIASDRALFADTHARVGVQPGWGLTVLLPQAIGIRRAKEMSATGNIIDAATALEWGLVNRVVRHEELLPSCRRLAADIVSNDAAGVRSIFATYEEVLECTASDGWRIEARNAREWLQRPEGVDFASRREAVQSRGRSQVGPGADRR